MDWGPYCTWFVADERPDIGSVRFVLNLGFFASFLNQSARSARVVEKRRKILHFMTPCEKQGRAGGEVCRDYSCLTLVLSIGIIFTRRQ